MAEVEINPQLWNACAGITIHPSLLDSHVCYFPQGHAEQTHTNVEFDQTLRVSPYILCKVIDVKLLGNLENEVYAKIKLQPLDYSIHDERISVDTQTVSVSESPCFAKNVTSLKKKNFHVTHTNANAVFPPLFCAPDDISAQQTLEPKDTHGKIWEFNHKYYQKGNQHQITSGWSALIKEKKANDEDSIVFVRSDNGDLHVGIRRAMKVGIDQMGKVRPEDVIQAVSVAAKREPFEVTYYPRATTSEFVVNASVVKTAMCTKWRDGMRFIMAFETDSLVEKTWFMGTVSSVQAVDPSHWPNSPWCTLQVKWDEDKDVLQNVKCVSPWQVQNPNIDGVEFEIPLPNQDLTIASSSAHNVKKSPKTSFQLFGQTIRTDQPSVENAIANEHDDRLCKVYLGSDDVCCVSLDLSTIESYAEVKTALSDMFQNEMVDDSTSVTYKDSAGVVKQMGEESFSDFVLKAKRLTILKTQ